ncbi:molybdopterin-guanine dinucleotide biosynthesis protein MobB [Methanopyrus sp. KOL6]|uniref:molybdopterin-guanine dinucleotide biosynthesis protein MobB n=1 Tax=Methanopyrus sp. KOL6 TaxID=1937004 RepID=UPI000B4A8773|nr:molybdopterin-guanine dinucleotide biosynthesis protein MobB [Methanopyrus sp. KOL6]
MLQVVGPKDSGKTSFCEEAVEGLRVSGYRVGYVKSVGEHHLDLRDRDTGRVPADVRVGMAKKETVLLLDLDIDSVLGLLALLGFDYVLIEGFKSRELGVRVGFGGYTEGPTVPAEELDTPPADVVERYAVKYTADINCGKCSPGSCSDFRRAVARGKEDPDGCAVPEDVTVLVDGKPLGLNPFVGDLVKSVVEALVGNLKGGDGNEVIVSIRR